MIKYSFKEYYFFFYTCTCDNIVYKSGLQFNLCPETYPVKYFEPQDIKTFRYSFRLVSNPSIYLSKYYNKLSKENKKIQLKKNKISLHMNLIYSVDTNLLTTKDMSNLVNYINNDFNEIEYVFKQLILVKKELLLKYNI
jgi:hypothetical protein